MSGTYRIVVLGLPESGKTTFLAALYHLVTAQEVASSFRVERLPGERGYLNQIRGTWQELAPLRRTEVDKEHPIELPLLDAENTELLLQIPDLAGETFERLWVDRHWPARYAVLCKEAVGLLLFIHPDKIREPRKIRDADGMLAGQEEQTPQDKATQVPPPWNPEETPTQVQLVELLQTVCAAAGRPLRLAVILSAWDLVLKSEAPDRFVARRMPLLAQFLRANDHRLTTRIYGVSAQGGDLADEAQRARLESLEQPSERVLVVGQDAGPHDLTAPLRFLLR